MLIDYNDPKILYPDKIPEITRSMGDDEAIVQFIKIGLGVLALVIMALGIFHLNKNLTTLIEQQGRIIELLKSDVQ